MKSFKRLLATGMSEFLHPFSPASWLNVSVARWMQHMVNFVDRGWLGSANIDQAFLQPSIFYCRF